ncbi:hypothetical protein HWV62_5223 [Athelia sp. TMB]|nr:hypothetical protein HWV62_5223 [Athelia sp. TMB]
MYSVKYAVLQYVIVRPLISVAGIVTQVYGVLCSSAGITSGLSSLQFANIYLEAADFISITVALYGLLLFYGLVADELKGRRPLAKFIAIKGIVMATFYQSFILERMSIVLFQFDMLAGRVIKPTQYWTETNISDGLNALTICIEMMFFASFMWWAYSPREYEIPGAKKGSAWRALWDSINFSDFGIEIYHSLAYFFTCGRRRRAPRPATDKDGRRNVDFGEAFGVSPSPFLTSSHAYPRRGAGQSSVDLVGAEEQMGLGGRGRGKDIQLAPYQSDYSAAYPDLSRPSLALGRTPTGVSITSLGTVGGKRGMMDLFPDRER